MSDARDAWRDLRGTGAHEWWYFDAIDAAANRAMTVIFFRGIPFSGVRQRHLADDADAYPAVAFALTGATRCEAYLVNLHRTVAIDDDRLGIIIGANRASLRNGVYTIAIDDELLDGRAVRASITFRTRGDSELADAAAGAEHLWIPAAIDCDVEASIAIAGEEPIVFRGRGYHDHNVGCAPLHEAVREWRWGRAHFRDHTIVFYESDRNELHGARIEDVELARNIYGAVYAKRLRVHAPRGVYDVTQSRIIDNGPFYIRFLSRFRAPDGEEVRGFSEVLRPRALRWRWFWPLLDTRVRPAGSGELLGRRITQWLIQRGF